MKEIGILILRMLRFVKFQIGVCQNTFERMLQARPKFHEKIPSRLNDIVFLSLTHSKHIYIHRHTHTISITCSEFLV